MNRIGHSDMTSIKSYDGTTKESASPVSNTYISEARLRRKSMMVTEKRGPIGLFHKTPPLSKRIRDLHNCGKGESYEKHSRRWVKCKLACKNISQTIELWGGNLRSIEGHQGTGVVSFFVLLRWLFGLNIVLCLITFFFVNVPVIFFNEEVYSTSLPAYSLVQTCTNNYTVTLSSDPLQQFLDFFLGTGWMEKSYLFYGFYTGSGIYVGDKNAVGFFYNFPLLYLLAIVGCMLISVFMMANHSISAFRKSLLSGEVTNMEYITMIFCGWDYSLSDERNAQIKSRNFKYVLNSDIQDQKFLKQRNDKMKSCGSRCGLYMIRILVNIFVLICLAGAACSIYYTSVFSSEWTAKNTVANGTDQILVFIVEFLPSIVITVLNAVLPLVFELVIQLEHYTQEFVIKLSLIRTVFLKLSSLIILVVSIYQGVISCEPKDVCRSTIDTCPNVTCWETYVGQELYKLVIIDFVVIIGKVFIVEFPRRLLANKCSWRFIKWLGPAEFEIPVNVLDLVYGQSICWLGFYFAPLFPAIYVIKLTVIFYTKMLSALYACAPPNRPYRAARTNSFFMIVLILAFFMCCFPVIYSIANVQPSHGCGPFRGTFFPYTVIPDSIATLPNGAQQAYNILTSPAVTASFIIILLLLLYFCSNMRVAHQKRNKILRQKFETESRDRQYILNQLKQETGKNRV
ncbi:transmembrane channel-like protein 7 [Patella vulgata]|uniref:transmembrane channel-like protein 7 n=1 Tax=Patella vulgata TaxID=6465 RepID=UPI00217F3EB2|nr:transmembrane channel-like protein 7 [Patella vulgata]